MTAATEPRPTFVVISDVNPDRISAIDAAGVEVAGAFRPAGHSEWRVYATRRLTTHTHFVIAPTQQVARWHVEMLAELWAGAR